MCPTSGAGRRLVGGGSCHGGSRVAATALGAAATPAPSLPAVDSAAQIRGADRALAVSCSGPQQALARGTPASGALAGKLQRQRLAQQCLHVSRSCRRRGRARALSPAPRPAGRSAVRDPLPPLPRRTRPTALQAPAELTSEQAHAAHRRGLDFGAGSEAPPSTPPAAAGPGVTAAGR